VNSNQVRWWAVLGVASAIALAASPAPDRARERVIIRLADPIGARANLLADVRRRGVTLDLRHQRAIVGLKAIHARSATAARQPIEEATRAGALVEIDRLWLINGVVAELDPEWRTRLEAHPAIAEIVPDRRLTLGEDFRSTPVEADRLSVPEEQLEQLNVPRVWAQGVTGRGAIVANVDSGVNGDDDTFGDRWRGRFAGSEASWLAPVSLTVFPEDDFSIGAGHGTSTMGLITGGDQTYGVAFDATWIAGDAFENGEGFVSNVIKIFEWLSDPDGDPATRGDVPDVVSNSFGLTNTDDAGQLICDTIFDDAIDALEAAGSIVVWSAGNEGQQGVTSPASRADSQVNAFSVGSVDGGNVVAQSSGRGPSACGGPNATKPEVVARGESVISRGLFNDFRTVSGTSFSTPMVAGVLALMRSKDPNITPENAKTTLLDTAVDLGIPGDDNDTGEGLVDAEAALARVTRPSQQVARLVGFTQPASGAKFELSGIEDALILRPGTSVSLIPVLTNHGASVSETTALLSSPTAGITITRSSIPLTPAGPGGVFEPVDTSTFGVDIGTSVSPGTDIVLDVAIQGASIGPFRMILKAGDPVEGTFATHDRGQVRLTVTNFGGFGFYTGIHQSGFVLRGNGFRFPTTSDNWLFHAGLMVGVGANQLSDDVPYGEDTQNTTDWFPRAGSPIIVDEAAGGQRITARYDDRHALAPLGVDIRQESFAFAEQGEDTFVLLQFVLTNTSPQTMGGLRAGLFADWDLPDGLGGVAETIDWDPSRRLGLVAGTQAGQPALGVVWLDDAPLAQISFAALSRAEIVSSTVGNPGTRLVPAEAPDLFGGEFSDQEKWNALTSGQTQTSVTQPQDAFQIIGRGPLTLGAGASDTVAVALVAGVDRVALQTAAESAREAYFNRVLGVPQPPPPPPPSSISLDQNFPNPFRIGQQTTIPFSVPGDGGARVELIVYDLLGQRVRTLIDGDIIAGEQAATWDGQADSGVFVPAGVYVVRLVTGGAERTIRVLVVR
jgi:hypothetical protein